MSPRRLFTLLLAVGLAHPAFAAPPDVPDRLSYQGVLLDDLGQPRTGTVDLTLRVWDALVGGTLVYKEVFSSVALTDGVFTVELGPTGAATDTPDDPLTTDLVTALSGDVSGASPVRFLEVTVGTTGALARSQLLTVPYALRAQSAAAADTATTATTAITATDASNVGGLSSSFVTQIYAHTNLDDSGPGNADPQEGLGDVDGDGIANFLDPDNDDDGLDDSTEVANGTSLNLVTPTISGFTPPTGPRNQTFGLAVAGTSFDPGQTVLVDGLSLPPANVTPTAFDVTVGPKPPGQIPVQVVLPNGESATASYVIDPLQPTVTGVSPNRAPFFLGSTVTVNGSNFRSGLDVVFGSETPTPSLIGSVSFQVTVGPQPPGNVDVTVTDPSGLSDTAFNAFEFASAFPHDVTFEPFYSSALSVNGEAQALLSGAGEYEVDTDGNVTTDLSVAFSSHGNLAGAGVARFDAAGTVHGLRCRTTGTNACDVEVSADSDADLDLDDETGAVIETLDANANIRISTADLAFDPSGGVAAFYVRTNAGFDAHFVHDRDGDGQFDGPNESLLVETGVGASTRSTVAVDASGRAFYAFKDVTQNAVDIGWDRSGDGDFDDVVGANPETQSIALVGSTLTCLSAGFAPDGDPVLMYSVGGSLGTLLFWDDNQDGDFLDANEVRGVAPGVLASGCDVDDSGPFAVVHNAGGSLNVLEDLDADGAFTSPGEARVLATGVEDTALRMARNASGRIFVATLEQSPFGDTNDIHVDATP